MAEKGMVKCCNPRCGYEFFPKSMLTCGSTAATTCPKCRCSVPLDRDFQLSTEIVMEWYRYNLAIPVA